MFILVMYVCIQNVIAFLIKGQNVSIPMVWLLIELIVFFQKS